MGGVSGVAGGDRVSRTGLWDFRSGELEEETDGGCLWCSWRRPCEQDDDSSSGMVSEAADECSESQRPAQKPIKNLYFPLS
jgi:hypothetical protein